VALAAASYFILHHYSMMEVAGSANSKEFGNVVSGHIFKTLAYIGQYLLPMAFLLGAAASAIHRGKRKGLFDRILTEDTPNELENMTWPEFEMLVA